MLKTQRELSHAARIYLEAIEGDDKFCRGCDGLKVKGESFLDPGEEECPCLKYPADEDCYRADQYEDIKSALMEADEIWQR